MAILWDTQTGQQVHQLSGHDEELTHTAAHPTARLVVTASKGQIISECPYEIIVSPIRPTKKIPRFLP